MCIEFESFFGKWEIRTGCLIAAFLGPFYSTLNSLYLWFGPYSSIPWPNWLEYLIIILTVYNCIVAVAAMCFAYGVLKEVSWPIDAYKNMWQYLTVAVASVWIGELIINIGLHPSMYMQSTAIFLATVALTALNVYFLMILRSYAIEMSE